MSWITLRLKDQAEAVHRQSLHLFSNHDNIWGPFHVIEVDIEAASHIQSTEPSEQEKNGRIGPALDMT